VLADKFISGKAIQQRKDGNETISLQRAISFKPQSKRNWKKNLNNYLMSQDRTDP